MTQEPSDLAKRVLEAFRFAARNAVADLLAKGYPVVGRDANGDWVKIESEDGSDPFDVLRKE